MEQYLYRHNPFSLRGLLKLCWKACFIVAFFCLFSVALPAHAAEKGPRIHLQWKPQAQFAGFIMAMEKGIFKKHGLPDTVLLWTGPGESPFLALAAGKTDYATGWLLTALQLRSEGHSLVNIAQLHQRSGSMLLARKDHGIHTLQDLNGKSILAWGGDFMTEFQLFLDHNQIKPGRVLPHNDTLAPFLHGLASAIQAMEYNEFYTAMERGMREEDLTIFRFADLDFNLAGDGLYTTRQRLHLLRGEAVAVRKAVLEGWAYAFANEEETIATVLRYAEAQNVRNNASHQKHMLRNIRAIVEYGVGNTPEAWGNLSEKDFDRARSLLSSQGHNTAAVPYTSFHVLP